MKVHILKTTSNGENKKLVVLTGDMLSAESLGIADGVEVWGMGGERFKPSDGRKYLEALRIQFSGSYIRATEVLA